MADQRPPRRTGDDRGTLLALLQFQRESLVRKVEGVGEEHARWSPVPSGTSLLWLVKHLAGAEATWVLRRFAGQTDIVRDDEVRAGDSVEGAIQAYREMWVAVDEVVAEAELDDLCQADERQPPVDLRWILAHLLEETARHAGHADLIREQLDGSTGR
jgi:uncharacterized damage-inducible protein DinB